VKRREFITLLGGAAAAWPLAARAQQAALPVIGYLHPGSPEGEENQVAAFRKGLAEIGFVEGRNVTIEFRWAHSKSAALPELVADLVRRRVAVIATPGSSITALAAKAATTTIPIVFSTSDDPVQAGLVASLNQPGGNITGFSSMSGEIIPKRLGLLQELVPSAMRFAVLINPGNPTAESTRQDVQTAASNMGREVEVFTAGSPGDIDLAFAALAQKRADALLVSPGPPFAERHIQLAILTAYHRLPAIYGDRQYAESGGLISYGSSTQDQFRQAGIYAGRVLRGEKPADLPVLRASKFDLVINLQTAKTLGLTVPPTLLVTADEVIE
jgi:putative ABC transport system substrate-binding protein